MLIRTFRCSILACLLLAACKGADKPAEQSSADPASATPEIGYSVVRTYPHDTSAYTQGFELVGDTLLEGTGMEGQSVLRKSIFPGGKVIKEVKLPADEFGEGITQINGRIYQLTWQDKRVHVYDAATLEEIRQYEWPYDGWGLTNNGRQLIISTGSNNLYFVDPETFKIQNTVGVTSNMGPVGNLNELEFVDGFVWANQYESNYIYKIDPATGNVKGRMDLTGIRQKNGVAAGPNDENMGLVLNGIAYRKATNTFLVTGKRWAGSFELKVN